MYVNTLSTYVHMYLEITKQQCYICMYIIAYIHNIMYIHTYVHTYVRTYVCAISCMKKQYVHTVSLYVLFFVRRNGVYISSHVQKMVRTYVLTKKQYAYTYLFICIKVYGTCTLNTDLGEELHNQ